MNMFCVFCYRVLEQICLVVLILGRWLLPKGKLSRNQFSQLMLVYIGMAADIVEVFEAFRESKVSEICSMQEVLFTSQIVQVMLEPSLTYAILGVWTWSLMQFCLVLGASHRGRKARYECSISGLCIINPAMLINELEVHPIWL